MIDLQAVSITAGGLIGGADGAAVAGDIAVGTITDRAARLEGAGG